MIQKKFFKILLLCLFSLTLLNTWGYSAPEKLGVYQNYLYSNYRNIISYENFLIAGTKNGVISVFNTENDEIELLKRKWLGFTYPWRSAPMQIYSHYLYIAGARIILVVDLQYLPEIKCIKTIPFQEEMSSPTATFIYNDKLIVSDYNDLYFFSLENPENPEIETTYIDESHKADYQIFATDNILVKIKGYDSYEILDISDLDNITQIYQYENSSIYNGILLDKNTLLLNIANEIYKVDISDLNNIQEPVSLGTGHGFQNFTVFGDYVTLVNTSQMYTAKISDFQNSSSVTFTEQNLGFRHFYLNFNTEKDRLYSFSSLGDKGIFAFNSQNMEYTEVFVDESKEINCSGDMANFYDYLYVASPYVGINIYKIEQNGNLTFIKTESSSGLSRMAASLEKVSTLNKDLIIACCGSRLTITDASDRENIPMLGTIAISAYRSITNFPYVYVVGYKKLTILDISDPGNIAKLSELDFDSYTHKYFYYYNNHLYLDKWIIDVSDPTNPQIVKDNLPGYMHAGIGKIMLSAEDYKYYLKVYDLSDPENPQEIETLPFGASFRASVLFTAGDKIICDCSTLKTGGHTTFIYSLQGQTPVLQYITDNDVKGFAEGENLVYAGGQDGFALVSLGKAYQIPHIANTWGWETALIADNYGDSELNYRLMLFDSIIISNILYNANKYSQNSFNLDKGQSGEVIVPFNSKISFKVSYHHTTDEGIAEFLLDDHVSQTLNLNMPHYLAENLTWMGLATNNGSVALTRTYFRALNSDGEYIDGNSADQFSYTRYASVLSSFFTNTNWQDIARISVNSENFVSGITISGNQNSKLLFTPATYDKARTDTRYLPHIDVNGYWNTYLVFDNPTDEDITVNLKLYSHGTQAVSENKTIPANSNLTVLLNDYADYAVDCGEISGCGNDLIVRLAYMFNSTGATAEFLIDGDEASSWLVFDLPAYRSNSLTWWGLAIMNPEQTGKDVTLVAYADGNEIDRVTIHLNGHTKFAALLGDIFANLNGKTVERIIAQTDSGYIQGLNISGSNQDRYLFTPAFGY